MYQKIEQKLGKLSKFQQLSFPETFSELRRQIFSNLSITHLKLDNFQSCIVYCKRVFEIDPENTKSHQRIAVAYESIKDFENAFIHLKKLKSGKKMAEIRELLKTERQRFFEYCFKDEPSCKTARQEEPAPAPVRALESSDVEIVQTQPKKQPQLIVVNGEEFWLNI